MPDQGIMEQRPRQRNSSQHQSMSESQHIALKSVSTSQYDVEFPDRGTRWAINRYENLCTEVFSLSEPLRLPVTSHKALKTFLSDELANLSPNVSTRKVSELASNFMFRKVLPSPPGDPVPSYLEKLSKIPLVEPSFVKTIRQSIPKLFRKGWDVDYKSYCVKAVISANSCLESSKSQGGARRIFHDISYERFLSMVLEGNVVDLPPVRKVLVLDQDGKVRIVTVASCFQQQLLPLHLTIYAHLSRRKWLLRGDASVHSLSEMIRDKNEVFVSGDYEAATDNFNASHSELMLRFISHQSSKIPQPIWDLAFASLTGEVLANGQLHRQSNGQLMGNLLSFPLLCLTNFLGVVHALGWKRADDLSARGLLKINGDDIVFRARIQEYQKWSDSVKECGLTLSVGKTLVHKRFFSLNSTFFRVDATGSPQLVPIIRSKILYTPTDNLFSVVGRKEALVKGWTGAKRDRLVAELLACKRRLLDPMVSLGRGLKMRVSRRALQKAGFDLLKREDTILEYPEAELPKPPKSAWRDGWHFVSSRTVPSVDAVVLTNMFHSECHDEAWGVVKWVRQEDGPQESHVPLWKECIPSKMGSPLFGKYLAKMFPKGEQTIIGSRVVVNRRKERIARFERVQSSLLTRAAPTVPVPEWYRGYRDTLWVSRLENI